MTQVTAKVGYSPYEFLRLIHAFLCHLRHRHLKNNKMNTQKPDLTAVNLAEIALKDGVMLRGGAAKCGACPKCGGKDRFHVRSFGGRNYFFCRQCHEQRGDAIEYMRWLHGMSFKQALDALGAKAAAHKPVERPIAEPVKLHRPRLASRDNQTGG